jgi:1,2-diacylglycerol 3-alpha-glucosyltransferase
MRIGLFTDSYPPYINGVSTSVKMLKDALEKKGHIVYVVTVNDSSVKYDYDEETRVLRVPGIPIGIYDYRLGRVYPVAMVTTMSKWKLDVIHSHTEYGIGTFARLFAKQFNIPLVHTYHTLIDDYKYYVTHGHFDKATSLGVEYMTKIYCENTATELIVPTQKIYKLFKEKYNFEKNIHIIPTGIEVDRFFTENVNKKDVEALKKRLGLTKKDFVVIFVGRLAGEKNVEFLLHAQIDLIKTDPHLKLLIVGDGPDHDKYADYIKENKLDKNIILNGKAAWSDMPLYYHCANVFTTASTTETQGLTIIEAMAASVVPLCIEDQAFHSMITEDLNGKFFTDEKSYQEQILYFLNHPDKLKGYDKEARIQAEHYSSSNYADRVLEVYKRAIIDKAQEDRFGIVSKIGKKIKEIVNDNSTKQ